MIRMVSKIEVFRAVDEMSDARKLAPFYGKQDGTPAEIRKWKREDKKRIDGWLNDEWRYEGVMARATILIIDSQDNPCRIIHEHESVWGVESDSDQIYFEQLAEDMLLGLTDRLVDMGFRVDDIESLPVTYQMAEAIELC